MEPEPAPTASSVLNEVAAHQNDNDDSDISTLKDNEEENEDKEQKIAAAIGAALVPLLQAMVETSVRTVLHDAITDLKHALLTELYPSRTSDSAISGE